MLNVEISYLISWVLLAQIYLDCSLNCISLLYSCVCFQEMVSVESFIELVKKRDIGRLKFAIRETNFDIDSRDEVR